MHSISSRELESRSGFLFLLTSAVKTNPVRMLLVRNKKTMDVGCMPSVTFMNPRTLVFKKRRGMASMEAALCIERIQSLEDGIQTEGESWRCHWHVCHMERRPGGVEADRL